MFFLYVLPPPLSWQATEKFKARNKHKMDIEHGRVKQTPVVMFYW